MEISLISDLTLNVSYNFEKGEVFLKETLNRRRKRDREPSRIPLKRILKVLNKKNIEKRYSFLSDKVFQRAHLSLIWVKTTKSGDYGTTEILFIANMPSTWRHRNVRWGKSIVAAYTAKSSLKGGMHHNTADSLWNCLSQRLKGCTNRFNTTWCRGIWWLLYQISFTSTLWNCWPTCRSSHGRDNSFT